MSENVDALKQLIAGTLEQRGVLAKIRAELRHHVFLALDEQESATGSDESKHTSSPVTKAHLTTKKKKLLELHSNPMAVDLLELVVDFCEFYEFEFTQALLHTEAEVTGPKANRKLLADKYSLSPSPIATQPLLLELLQRHTGAEVPVAREERPTHRQRGSMDSLSSGSIASPRENSSDSPKASSSRRALYRERAAEESSDSSDRRARSLSFEGEKLSPRGGLGGLAPLGAVKKPASLGGLAPLAPLGKSSLAPLSTLPPPKKLSPAPLVTATSPTTHDGAGGYSFADATSPSNALASTRTFGNSAPKSAVALAPTPAPAAGAPSVPSRQVEEELDLDALEAEVFGAGSPNSSSGATFMPGGDDASYEDQDSYRSSTAAASKSSRHVAASPASNLSSLAAAPSLKSSSLGSLAPLAPLGGGRNSSGWSSSSSSRVADVDTSHDSLPEDDARQVVALDSQIARLAAGAGGARSTQQPQYQQQQHDQSDNYDEPFVEADQGDISEDIEIEADYDEEEF